MKLVLLALASSLAMSNAATQVRGIPDDKASLYKPDKNGKWKCLGNPEIELSFDQVNDDYCDCPDGSDEPGTAACNNGQFYCKNVGHIGAYIPSSKVNDGVCDYDVCCDGSDEHGLDPSLCPDRCAEIHAEYERKRKERAAIVRSGLKARAELVRNAAQLREDLSVRVIEKQRLVDTERTRLLTLQQDLDEAIAADRREKLERGVSEESLSLPSELEAVSNKIRAIIEEDRQLIERAAGVESQYGEIGDAMDRLRTGYNPNFNDPAVKEALREWDVIKGKGPGTIGIARPYEKLEAVVKELEAYRPGASAESSSSSSWLPASIQKRLTDTRAWLVEQGVLAEISASRHDGESEAIRVHRNRVESSEKSISDGEHEVQQLQADLDTYYGEGDVLRSLKDQCIKNRIGEYDYEVCFFKSTAQTGNGQNSNLGTYVSTEYRSDGTFRMDFDHGTRCWNGPIRKSNVEFSCGSENKLTIVSEPEKCEYFFKATTPAACIQDPEEIVHDEL